MQLLRAIEPMFSLTTNPRQSGKATTLGAAPDRNSHLAAASRWLRLRMLALSDEEASFTRRGFPDAPARVHLETVGKSFLRGYNAALDDRSNEALVERLSNIEIEFRGFAFEGASMGLALLDSIALRKKGRFRAFLNGAGSAHIYMAHVGVGWVMARLPWKSKQVFAGLDPLLRWLAIDGYGFHQGYFHWRRFVENLATPPRLSGYAKRVFDQGLGRSLWFVNGADVKRIPKTIAAFQEERRRDLWSGVGLACAYAGGVDRPDIEALRAAAGHYRPHLAQGVAFAAKARKRAGNLTPATAMACEVICDLDADKAAASTDAALENLVSDGQEPDYEVWRRRIRAGFAHLWS